MRIRNLLPHERTGNKNRTGSAANKTIIKLAVIFASIAILLDYPASVFSEINNAKEIKSVAKPAFKTVKIAYKSTFRWLGGVKKDEGSDGIKVTYIDTVKNRRRDEETEIFTKDKHRKQSLRIRDGNKGYLIRWPDIEKAYYFDIMPGFYAWMDYEWRGLGPRSRFIGNGEVLRRKCDIYESSGEKIWLWGAIVLKKEVVTDASRFDLEAINIEEEMLLRDDKFKVPTGTTIRPLKDLEG